MLKRFALPLALLLFAGTGALSALSATPEAPPALSMLRSENGRIVNESGQPIQLRAENIGNWLAWEQWIQRFKPDRFFNQLGRIVGEGDKSNRIELDPAQGEGHGTELQELCWQKAATGFGPGDYLRFKNVTFNSSLGAYIFRYVQSNQVPGAFELRADAVDGPLLARIETAYSKGEECHNAEARGLLLTSLDGPHDLYLVARHPAGPCNAAVLHLSLIDIENKASAEELYDLLVDNVDASLTLYATDAQKKSGVGIAYDCQPDGIGGYGNGDYIEFQNVNLPAGLTNLSLIAATANDHTNYDGRFRIEITDASGIQHLFGEVPLFNSGGWNNYEEYAIYNGTPLPGGPCSIRITGVTGEGVGDVGNLHSLRFFRADRANALIERYRDAYFTAADLDWLQSIGINCLRVPFNYDLIMNDAGELLPEEQWSQRLDWVVAECGKRGMTCILDLHATPGGQNDYEQCMRKEGIRNRLWYVPEHQNRLVRLWAAIAKHYKGNPAVAGYDLFNEPAPWWHSGAMNNELPARYNQYILPLHRRLYEAIRAEDSDHLIFMEDNAHMTWNARFLDKLPDPRQENWSNVVYEIHSYEHAINSLYGDWRDSDVLTQKDVADENIRHIIRFQNERGVPVFIGEFQPIAAENYDYALRRYNRFGINWCHWNFKVAGWGNRQFPERGWDHWGLQYRINPHTPELVDLQSDSFDTLAEKFDAFDAADFQPNAHLMHVIEPRNRLAGETLFTELYQATFAAPDTMRLDHGWCGDTATLVGRPEAFSISNSQLRLATGDGPAALRLKSRKETEAHFNLNAAQCLFSAAVSSFGGEENASNTELSLSFTRDLITNALLSTFGPAITARLLYNGTNQVKAYLSSIDNAAETVLTEGDWMPFISGAAFVLKANNSEASIAYGDWTSDPMAHGQPIADWPEGGLAVVAARGRPGREQFVELDRLLVEQVDAPADEWYVNTFNDAPELMMLRALPDQVNILRSWSSSRSTSSFIQDSAAVFLPNDENYQSVWMNLYRDYQNPLCLRLDEQHAAGLAATLSAFTEGRAKYCLMPESFYGNIWNDYDRPALYVEMRRDGDSIECTAFQHRGIQGDREALGIATCTTYVDGAPLALQMDAKRLKVFYNRKKIIEVDHGIPDAAAYYQHGIYPHIEFQNFDSTNAYIVLDDLVAVSLTE